MKTTLIFSLFAMVTSTVMGQKLPSTEIPSSIATVFAKSHPRAKNVKWNKENANFEVSFEEQKAEMSVVYSADGSEIEIETEIEWSQLPEPVRQILKKDYLDHELKEYAKIVSGKEVTYEVEVSKKKQSFDLLFDANGVSLKKVAASAEKED